MAIETISRGLVGAIAGLSWISPAIASHPNDLEIELPPASAETFLEHHKTHNCGEEGLCDRLQGLHFPKDNALHLVAQQQVNAELVSLIGQYNSNLSPSERREIARWTEFYSLQYGIDMRLVAALVARESGFNPKATSRSGAKGLGQISAILGEDLGIGDRYDVRENLEGTTRWIRTLYDTWRANGVGESQATHWTLASYRQGLMRTQQVGIPAYVADYINEVYEIANRLPHP